MAEKSAQNVIDSIEGSRNPTLARLIHGLGIRHVGRHVAKVVADHFGSLDALRQVSEKALSEVPEIGPTIAQSVAAFFGRPETDELLRKLSNAGVVPQQLQKVEAAADSPILGKTFVFTGALSSFDRKEAEFLVNRLGGKASSNVSRKTDYVVVGDSPGSKHDKAVELGITILSEEQFARMVGA